MRPVRGDSSLIHSNQHAVHKDLVRVVTKYAESSYLKPIADHTAQAFAALEMQISEYHGALILDSGCGTGMSTKHLAGKFPNHFVIGIDKSAARLNKCGDSLAANALLMRAELVDVWRLMAIKGWQFERHYLFYPNPWPKEKHLRRRWHAHPIFTTMLSLSPHLEIRTNWSIYAQEFVQATEHLMSEGRLSCNVDSGIVPVETAISLFEQKYRLSGHQLHQVILNDISAV